MPADVLVQLGRGGIGFYAKLVGKGLHANAVLHQGEMRQALPAVTAHQPAVRVFPAGISFDDAQAQTLGFLSAGGLSAGMFAGWRATRLRPPGRSALRRVDMAAWRVRSRGTGGTLACPAWTCCAPGM